MYSRAPAPLKAVESSAHSAGRGDQGGRVQHGESGLRGVLRALYRAVPRANGRPRRRPEADAPVQLKDGHGKSARSVLEQTQGAVNGNAAVFSVLILLDHPPVDFEL